MVGYAGEICAICKIRWEYARIVWDILAYARIFLDMLGHTGICWNTLDMLVMYYYILDMLEAVTARR